MVKIRQSQPNIRLRDQRRLQGWTQADIAKKLGITDLTVGRWERGETVPFPYYQQKLCALFDKTPAELGLTSTPAPGQDEEQDEQKLCALTGKAPAELGLTSTSALEQDETQDEQKLDKSEEDLAPAHFLLPHAELSQMASNEGKNHGKFRLLAPQSIAVFIGMVLVLIAGAINIFSHWGQPTTNSVLYHTDWSRGPDQWPVSTNLHWSNKQGGSLETDQTTANTVIFSPYTGSTATYAVEAQIQRIGYSDAGGQAYGLALEATAGSGYVCGVGIHYLPEHFFIAHSNSTGIAPYWLTDLTHQPASLDHSWHTYLMDVRKNKITFSIDGKVIQSAETPSYTQTGRVGLYVDNAAIAIKSFRVLALA